MPFTSAEIAQLETLLSGSDGGARTIAEFRRTLPGKSCTRCDASDMGGEAPFRQFAALDLYLVDGSDHCWHITGDPAHATGVVMAVHSRRA